MEVARLPELAAVLSSNAHLHHLLFQEERRFFQVVYEGDLNASVKLLTSIAFEKWQSKPQLNAISCFMELCRSGKLRIKYFPAEPRGMRLAAVLRALDLSLGGASHRHIGEAIYGIERIDRDWNDPGDHLKDRVRRLVVRGRSLMAGGYRQLLK
ncbi:MAG TPA: DUF2285 domain-containing protein [Terriglobia bacterium]|nr:DUF2285 domain-containing protein [Terriglobia bacterium]